ncbi:MAG: ABC transporter substrate-binding protein, partial [Salinisphaeraceae bacterium]|nr:ABC transporter substrate-binding protein [Salinisphaeraceae bacterium]
MRVQRTISSLFLVFLLLASGLSQAAETETAEQVVKQTSNELMSAIEPQKAALREDSAKLYKLVEEIVLPHFDFDFISRLVLGKAWKQATPEEQQRFSKAFQTLLVRTYSNAL